MASDASQDLGPVLAAPLPTEVRPILSACGLENKGCWEAPLLASLENRLPLTTHSLLSAQHQLREPERTGEPDVDFPHPSLSAGVGVTLYNISRYLLHAGFSVRERRSGCRTW